MWKTVDISVDQFLESVTGIAMRQYPSKHGQSPKAISMSGQRRKLWFNIEIALGEWHVFDDHDDVLAQNIQQTQCWISVGPAS